MKERTKGIVTGVLLGCTLTSGLVFAKNITETIEAVYSDIKIYVDGVKLDAKDPNGNTVEPFIYNGTTYLPVRAVGEAVGKTVTWDGTTKSVYLGIVPGEKQYLTDVCPPYQASYFDTYNSESGQFVTIGGVEYTNSFRLGYKYGGFITYAIFNLDGKYNKLNFEVASLDGSSENASINVFLDGKLAKTFEIDGEALAQKMSLDLNGALQMKMELIYGSSEYGIINAVVE